MANGVYYRGKPLATIYHTTAAISFAGLQKNRPSPHLRTVVRTTIDYIYITCMRVFECVFVCAAAAYFEYVGQFVYIDHTHTHTFVQLVCCFPKPIAVELIFYLHHFVHLKIKLFSIYNLVRIVEARK